MITKRNVRNKNFFKVAKKNLFLAGTNNFKKFKRHRVFNYPTSSYVLIKQPWALLWIVVGSVVGLCAEQTD